MARPRRVLPGRTYLLTRRCSERRFFLKPSPIVEHIYTYILAVAALRFGVLLHAAVVMSNHHHIVLTDVHGNLPRFCHLMHSLIARMLNLSYDRCENFWGPGSYSAVLLAEPDDVLDKMAYVLANPVAAGLVERGTEWPGFITTPKMLLGKRSQGIVVKRPGGFFIDETEMPEMVELTFCCPPSVEAVMSKEEAAERLQRRREAKEEAARRRAKDMGVSFLGKDGIRAQDPFDCPDTQEPRFQLSPNLACRDMWKRIELLQESSDWHNEYDECRWRFKMGEREVEFPRGTWGPVVIYGARAKPPEQPPDPSSTPPPPFPPSLAA